MFNSRTPLPASLSIRRFFWLQFLPPNARICPLGLNANVVAMLHVNETIFRRVAISHTCTCDPCLDMTARVRLSGLNAAYSALIGKVVIKRPVVAFQSLTGLTAPYFREPTFPAVARTRPLGLNATEAIPTTKPPNRESKLRSP